MDTAATVTLAMPPSTLALFNYISKNEDIGMGLSKTSFVVVRREGRDEEE